MLRGLKKTLCTPGPIDPTETEPELCPSVSCRGTGQQWTAAGAGALGAEEVAINPTIEPSELTQDWGNRLLEGTNKSLRTLGPRRREQTPQETDPGLPVCVQEPVAQEKTLPMDNTRWSIP